MSPKKKKHKRHKAIRSATVFFLFRNRSSQETYLCTARTKLLPACNNASCACPWVKLLIDWSFSLTTTSPTFKPIHSARLSSVTCRSHLRFMSYSFSKTPRDTPLGCLNPDFFSTLLAFRINHERNDVKTVLF